MSVTLDEEQQADTTPSSYRALVDRLSRQSVEKHFDAYADVDWDAPEMQIDPADPRWELSDDDPVGQTDWYQGLPQEERARIGLHRVVTAMKIGVQFESVLKRGLLEWATRLPNGAPEFRYAYHEVIEEAQHSLMFQEFVNRSGFDPPGLPWHMRVGSRVVVGLGRRFPVLFFLFVLGGEDPIDYTQRRWLRRDDSHPLLARIMRIHVTEEARHLSFARHYLRHQVPQLGRLRRFELSVAAPLLLGEMARQMLHPSAELRKAHGASRRALKQQVSSRDARRFVRDSLGKVRRLCIELGLVNGFTRRLWIGQGIWEPRAAQP
jgi:P-aminobenzoate N-oxygenase AurF